MSALELRALVALGELAQPARGLFEQALQDMTARAEFLARRHASGAILQRRSGRLARRIRGVVRRIGGQVREAALLADTEYAAIQELGGVTRPHLIRPVRAAVLRFEVDGEVVFARIVHHPGSRIPARPYLSPAWELAAEGLPGQLDAGFVDLVRRWGRPA